LSEAFQMRSPLCFGFHLKQDRTPRTNAMGETRDDLILPTLGGGRPTFFPAIILVDLLYH